MRPAAVKTVTSDLSDLEIAQRIAAGDRDQLRLLMRRYNQRLYRTARSILKDDAEAEDAVQESYLLAYQAMGDFRGGAKLSTWLLRIVVNEAIGRVRKRSRRAELIQLDGTIDPEERDLGGEHERCRARAAGTRRAACGNPPPARDQDRSAARRVPHGVRTARGGGIDRRGSCRNASAFPRPTVRTRYFRAKGLLRESLAREIDLTLEDAFAFAGERCDRIVAGVLARLADLPTPAA